MASKQVHVEGSNWIKVDPMQYDCFGYILFLLEVGG